MKEKIEVSVTSEQLSFLQDLVIASSNYSTVGEAAAWLIGAVLDGVNQARSNRGDKTLAASVKPWDLRPAPTERIKEVTDLIGLSGWSLRFRV